ncbi:MAG: hypothetical protein IPM77_16820 [Crocinitomicaceae bacterium]|nr:hypothetical protein [Crocinitomicaceae bacterium]
MKKYILITLLLLSFTTAWTQTEQREYVSVRVQYGKTISGFKYELYLDIGESGKHSMSGEVTNVDEHVIISDDQGKQAFKSDIDLINYLTKRGYKVIHTGEIQILDQHYYTYLLERVYVK